MEISWAELLYLTYFLHHEVNNQGYMMENNGGAVGEGLV